MEHLCRSPSSTLSLNWCVSWGKSDRHRRLPVWCQCQQGRETEEQHCRRTTHFLLMLVSPAKLPISRSPCITIPPDSVRVTCSPLQY
ncbi:hypothetical protein RHGRI_011117 [Rhododendron griersonianum]|uniref:Uncharacterized protein n=1 Tax=Rhododendron griersonianum TaxID=479676 RepID=A0AAV6KLA7_9ERIC|nr:hypothetical protein RHGRI_011117 [Rhododendron griersonianum]